MNNHWLSPAEAVTLVQDHIGGSIGRATNTLKLARASGEVRVRSADPDPVLLIADDGIVGMDLRAGPQIFHGIDADGKLASRNLAQQPRKGETISEDDLLDWLNRKHGPSAAYAVPSRQASTQEIRAAMFSIANDPANDRPNVKDLAKLTKARLLAAGAIVSENQVIRLADAPEFKALRRPPGKTKRSGG